VEDVNEIKGERLYVDLGASKVRRRLKGHGFGVRKVHSDGKNRAVIIHTATSDHLRQLEALFQDVLTTPTVSPQPRLDEED
jgi:DNA transformation protein and related proteins